VAYITTVAHITTAAHITAVQWHIYQMNCSAAETDQSDYVRIQAVGDIRADS